MQIDNPIAELTHEEVQATTRRLIKKNKISYERDGTHTAQLLLGKPGVGKSQIYRQIAAEHNMAYHEERLSYKNPVDVTGWPYVPPGSDRLHMAIPPNYPTNGQPCLFHLEEINMASEETLKAAQQLLLENRIGEYQLPIGSLVVASGNRVDDYANVVSFSSAQIDRVALYTLRCTAQDWIPWATDNDVHPLVISMIKFFPDLLHTLPDAEDGWDRQTQFATPRSWEAYSDYLKTYDSFSEMLVDTSLFQREAVGVIGHRAASQLVNTVVMAKSMPTVEQIAHSPYSVPLPEDLVQKVIACSYLALGITADNSKSLLEYVKRDGFGEEVRRYFINLVMGSKPEANEWPSFYDAIRNTTRSKRRLLVGAAA